jgi:hypothetical protein
MSATKKNAVASTSARAREAAESMIVKGGALAAVVAGAFAAAAAHESVLLGPVQVLGGGAGVGLFAWDGRVRQPGKGVARPRGFLPEDAVPDAARVGASAFVAALVGVLAHANTLTLAQAMAPALAAVGKKSPRAALLARIRDRGTRAFLDEATPLVDAAGRLAGGVLTKDDLEGIDVKLKRATLVHDHGVRAARVPWGATPETLVSNGCTIHAICAADRGGAVAALAWEENERGIEIPALGLRAPFFAMPVKRGEERVRPGTPLAAPAPIALIAVGEWVNAAIAARPVSKADATEAGAEAALVDALAKAGKNKSFVGVGDAVIGVVAGKGTASTLASE